MRSIIVQIKNVILTNYDQTGDETQLRRELVNWKGGSELSSGGSRERQAMEDTKAIPP